jgi:hypothetical protein
MSSRFVLEGLDPWLEALRQLPGELRDEARTIVHDTATHAADEMRAAYPEGPRGRLKRGVKVALHEGNEFGAGAAVKNTAPHAFIFEQGTQARYVSTLPLGRAKNFGYRRGAMPPGRVFIPIAIRRRRAMYQALVEVVRRNGFEVTGAG